MSSYGDPVYGEYVYGEGQDNTSFFLTRLIECLPPAYRPPEHLDFLTRFLRPSAETFDFINRVFDELANFLDPSAAPEEWVDWMLTEWFGWTLVPAGFPLARKRQLLANLHLHYKRRYTVKGVTELLKEFNVVAEVYDDPIFVGGWYGTYGSAWPLRVRVRVTGYLPFENAPKRSYAGSFLGGQSFFAHTVGQIITEDFVMRLVNWSRLAGVEYLVEFVTRGQSLLDTAPIPDDDSPPIP